MHRFYVSKDQIQENNISITGQDVNHIKNVLRMKPGDEIVICDGQGKDCYCIINRVCDDVVIASVNSIRDTGTELPVKITLFQGLPKSDKMELIIQKAVELGVYEIVPVVMARSVVKYADEKKEAKKLLRWQAISESAAKQSGRGIIPKILPLMTYKEAIAYANEMDLSLLPYENAKGIAGTKESLKQLQDCKTAGIIIGPEGGYESSEIELALEHNMLPISLGKRILRTETAGLALLSMIMLYLEE
ncbi:MAG: 16S rRNA (uracil(1498)-N(3))-methyltransferase [Anaerolineaceae bacterium]|nr:MAG: 16S rRNA (uracil(1498)-N(3))-methyltransferase [Anaerolineaceae bacterium]